MAKRKKQNAYYYKFYRDASLRDAHGGIANIKGCEPHKTDDGWIGGDVIKTEKPLRKRGKLVGVKPARRRTVDERFYPHLILIKNPTQLDKVRAPDFIGLAAEFYEGG